MNILPDQYELIKDSRKVLLEYCDTLSLPDLNTSMETFGGRSICFLLTHIANVYKYWLEHIAMERKTEFFKDEKVDSVQQIREIFIEVNKVVNEFIDQFGETLDTSLSRQLPRENKMITVTPIALFLHTITHEFHHKGQVLSISRQLGYTPPDTDVIRFE